MGDFFFFGKGDILWFALMRMILKLSIYDSNVTSIPICYVNNCERFIYICYSFNPLRLSSVSINMPLLLGLYK